MNQWFDYILDDLEEQVNTATRDNGGGAASSWENYKKRVGYIAGLRAAMDTVKDLKKRYNSGDEADADSGNNRIRTNGSNKTIAERSTIPRKLEY